MWTYKCDRCGAALDPGERCDCQDRPAKYNGKPIFTQENFNYSEAKIRACNFAVQFYNLTVQFICVILIHNERVWVEKTVINTKLRASFL